MGAPREGRGDEGDSRSLDRILTLSDGVFAIALTLLVLNIEVPEVPLDLVAEELPGELLALWPKFLSYVISFVMIIFYWMAHHSIFGVMRPRQDAALAKLAIFDVRGLSALPHRADRRVRGSAAGGGDLRRQPSRNQAALEPGLVVRLRQAAPGERRPRDPGTKRAFNVRAWAIPLIFLASIAISFFSVTATVYSWVLLVIADFVLLRVLCRSG